MPATSRELLQLASETGFEASSVEKVLRLAEVLGEVVRHPALEGKLLLKGGTALNLFIDSPRRLSVDLDFNYVGASDRETMLEERPEVENAIEAIGHGLGFTLQRSRQAHAGSKFYLTYASSLGGTDRVEVDLNFLHRVCLLSPQPRRLWRPDGRHGPVVPLVSMAELAAGKLCALLDRKAARDLWDTANLPSLLERWPPDLLRPVFVALAGALPHSLASYSVESALEVPESDMRRLLRPMLTGGEEPTVRGLREQVETVISPLLALTDREREFSDRLQQGELRPELLFPERPEIADRVARHPILLWKTQNATAHRGRTA